MIKLFLTFIGCIIIGTTHAQVLNAYQIFNEKGEPVTFGKMVETLLKSEIVLFGELHGNPIAHWLQLETSEQLHERNRGQLILGAEMFEADNQLILNEYLGGFISQRRFEEDARLWINYKTDYKPLVEFAKKQGLPFVATNIPRRYAAMVATGGFEALKSLSHEAKQFIAPLPVEYDPELPGYKPMLSMTGMPGRNIAQVENFPKAQAIKDATMAWFINSNLKPNHLFVHFNGTYHSNNFEGIYWYLKRLNPQRKIATIATVVQDSTETLDEGNRNLAHFIIVVPSQMTRTH